MEAGGGVGQGQLLLSRHKYIFEVAIPRDVYALNELELDCR